MSDKNIFDQYNYCTGHSTADRTWQHKAQKRVCFEFHKQIIKDVDFTLVSTSLSFIREQPEEILNNNIQCVKDYT